MSFGDARRYVNPSSGHRRQLVSISEVVTAAQALGLRVTCATVTEALVDGDIAAVTREPLAFARSEAERWIKALAEPTSGREFTFKPGKAPQLAQELAVGDLLYCAPCVPDASPAKRYDAKRGEAPGFAELRAQLLARGLVLEIAGPFYWRCKAATP